MIDTLIPPAPPIVVEPVPRNHRRVVLPVVAVFGVLVVGTVGTVAVTQHGRVAEAEAQIADAKAETAKVTDERDEVREDLAATEEDLSTLAADLSDAEGTLAACAKVVEVSDLQYDQSLLLLKATQAALDTDYATSAAKLGLARDHIAAVDRILEESGAETFDELWSPCAAEYIVM